MCVRALIALWIYYTIRFDAQSFPAIRRNRDRPRCQIERRPEKFSRLLIVSMAIKGWREGTSGTEKALSYRFREEGRVIVNSRSVNRRKIRSEWFEFLSRETNGRRDSRILMCHTKGAKVACFLYFFALAFYGRGIKAEPCLANMGSQ